jgi:beta-N-acetylhexosaminidase
LSDNGRVLPLVTRPGRRVLITGWGDGPTRLLAARVAGRGLAARRVLTDWAPGAREVAAAVAAAGQADLVLLVTSDAWRDAGQRRLASALLATGRPVVVATLGGPYDLAYLGPVAAALAAYGSLPDSVNAVADVLFGAQPQGRLPVTVPVAGHPGRPLYRYGTGLRY